jgi:hypothetical protein
MAFKEEAEVNYTIINGKKVPVVKCETEVVLRNTVTNQEYNSDKVLLTLNNIVKTYKLKYIGKKL